jgi:hypothetical protein
MKNIITGFAAGVLLLLAISYFFKPAWLCGSIAADDRKPLLSLADLAMEAGQKEGNDLATLVALDKQFYKDLLNGNKVSSMYFYSRHGSCCPCSSGGTKCCMCPPRSGMGAPVNSTDQAYLINQSAFQFAANQKVQSFEKLDLEKSEAEGVKIFLIPQSVKAGNYKVKFEGKINIELDIAVNADRSFDVVAIR